MSNIPSSSDHGHAELSSLRVAAIIGCSITAFFSAIVLGCAFAPTIITG